MKKTLGGLLWVLLLFIGACGSNSSISDNPSIDGSDSFSFTVVADFMSPTIASLSKRFAKASVGQCEDRTDLTMDSPILEEGLDCDDDGGIVTHITPTQYSVAFKKIVLVPEDVAGEDAASIDIIADTGTLAQSQVVDFTTDSTSATLLDGMDVTTLNGSYAGVQAEIYYIQMTFPVAGVVRNVRIYFSDDDFEAEGNLGHHQGDITFAEDDDTELGWVDSTWLAANLVTTRGSDQNGAGETDAETGHDRGFFGNAEFWNAAELQQGSAQDIFTTTIDFDEPLDFSQEHTGITTVTVDLNFSVADTFYYEDFAPQNTADFPGFYPGDGGEATSEQAEWAPLEPSIAAIADSISAL